MENKAFDWQLDEFMVYCRSRQLREKMMNSYEQTLRLFERWCREQLNMWRPIISSPSKAQGRTLM